MPGRRHLRRRKASDAPGYPAAVGTHTLRAAIIDWMRRRRGVSSMFPLSVGRAMEMLPFAYMIDTPVRILTASADAAGAPSLQLVLKWHFLIAW